MANYEPLDSVGYQRTYIRRSRIRVIVTWRPSWVDNPKPAKGYLAERHKMTRGDIAEAIVWHEL
jgi:hypothetical protein